MPGLLGTEVLYRRWENVSADILGRTEKRF
jgi:hypothetical protein